MFRREASNLAAMARPHQEERVRHLGRGWGLVWVAPVVLSVACGGATPAAETAEPEAEPEVTSAAAVSAPEMAGPDRRAELAQDSTREQTIRTLLSEYAEAAKHGSGKDEAKAFIERYAGPLAQAYVDGHDALPPELRVQLSTILVSFKDARTVPAHTKALLVYAKSGEGIDEAIWACQAGQRLKDEQFGSALLAVFEAIDMSSDDGHRLSRHLTKAMRNNLSNAWSARLIDLLGAPLVRPERFDDKPGVRRYQNALYWQTTSAELLGEMRASGAVKPLARVLLDLSKQDLHPQAELALASIGKPALGVAHGLLSGDDADLVALAKKARPDVPEAHVYFATQWLTKLRHPSSTSELEAAWESTSNPQSKVLIARALTYFPKNERTLDIFRKTYVSSSLKLTLPAGESALEALVENSPYLFEPKLADWLMDQPGRVRGAGHRKGDVQRALVVAIAQLALESQLKDANKVSQAYGGRTGTPAFERSKAQVTKCKADPKCYAGELAGISGASAEDVQVANKALTMLGVFGTAKERDALIARLSDFTDPRLTEVATRVIGQLTPKADAATLEAVQAEIASAGEPTDPAKRAALTSIRFLLYQLRARA